ncbi:unnamed protein product [Musa acuminata subsp. burmannicoides]
MKVSVRFPEDRPALVRAKIPVGVLGLPFISGAAAAVGDTRELRLDLSTAFSAGPSFRLSYRPNDPHKPFSLVLKTGAGPLGSPAGGSPLAMSAEFGLFGARPTFSLLLKPRFGDFTFKKSVAAAPAAASPAVELNGFPIDVSAFSAGSRGGIDGLLSGFEVSARSVLPLPNRTAIHFKWGLRVPPELRTAFDDPMARISLSKLPLLAMRKISIERLTDDQDAQKKNPAAATETMDACALVRQEIEALQSESKLLRGAVEDLRAEVGGWKFTAAGTNGRSPSNTGKHKGINEELMKPAFMREDLRLPSLSLSLSLRQMASAYVVVVLPFVAALMGSLWGGASAHGVAASSFNSSSFPAGFVFGAASAAYQYEGAFREGGKGPSIWDTFTHHHPEKIMDRSNGDVAVDSYHRYKEDVALMKEMGVDAHRFSISWSRILPNGKLSGGVNKEGVKHYNDLIDELLSNGLQPFVTLFHWDLPQALEDQYGGFLSPFVVKDFRDFVEVCFREFGDRVKHWITFNEPLIFSTMGYATGQTAPGRCTPILVGNCTAGNSGREPYVVAHHQLLAHAAAVKLYRDKYQGSQKGRIGITLTTTWFIPLSDSKSDVDAAQRILDFNYGWFMDPLTGGDYPFIMRTLLGDRLPRFTDEESRLIKGSFDFIGLNYYTASYAYGLPLSKTGVQNYMTDSFVSSTAVRNGVPIGPQAASSWLYVYPKGIRDLLLYTKSKYNNPVIYITENGIDEVNDETVPLEEALEDKMRVEYYKGHLLYLQRAIRKGADVRGFFMWTLLDDFEWNSGYTVRFGLHYVDFKDGLKRYPKRSALWFREFLRRS